MGCWGKARSWKLRPTRSAALLSKYQSALLMSRRTIISRRRTSIRRSRIPAPDRAQSHTSGSSSPSEDNDGRASVPVTLGNCLILTT